MCKNKQQTNSVLAFIERLDNNWVETRQKCKITEDIFKTIFLYVGYECIG